MLHVFNTFVSDQIFRGNRYGLVGKGAYCTRGGKQSNILAQNVGSPFRLGASAAVGVHHLFADGVEHHILCPFKGGIRRLVHQVLISVICRQIRIGVGVLGIFISSGVFQIRFRRIVLDILGILLCALSISHEFAVIAFCQLLARILSKRVVLRLIVKVDAIFSGGIDFFHRRLLVIIFRLPLCLCLALISKLHIGFVIVAILLQPSNIGAFVGILSVFVLLSVNQSGIDPAMHHVVHALRGTGSRCVGQRVNETTVYDSQLHVPFFGFDGTHAHIAAVCRLRQIDVAFGAGVDLRTVTIRGIYKIRGCNLDSLIIRAYTAVFAGQIDTPAYYGSIAARLGNIPCSIQGHIAHIHIVTESRVSVLALERHQLHVPRQGLILLYAACGCDIDISRIGGNSTEPDIVRHRGDLAIAILDSLTDGNDMDILDIVFCLQSHNLALQGGVVILEDAAPCGVDRQRSLIIRIGHISRQVDAAPQGIGAFQVDAAGFRADQSDGDGMGGIHRIVIELDGGSAVFPPIVDMLEPAKETGTCDPMFPVKNSGLQKTGTPIKVQFAVFRDTVASLRNNGALR